MSPSDLDPAGAGEAGAAGGDLRPGGRAVRPGSAAVPAAVRRTLARFQGVEVVVGAFEDWPLPSEPFDLVQAATVFHWIDRSGRLGPATFRRHEWELPYTAAGYLEAPLTYSGHRALDPAARAGLLDCIASLIDHGYGGRITKRYLTELRVAFTGGP